MIPVHLIGSILYRQNDGETPSNSVFILLLQQSEWQVAESASKIVVILVNLIEIFLGQFVFGLQGYVLSMLKGILLLQVCTLSNNKSCNVERTSVFFRTSLIIFIYLLTNTPYGLQKLVLPLSVRTCLKLDLEVSHQTLVARVNIMGV